MKWTLTSLLSALAAFSISAATLQPRTATLLKSCAESDFGNEGERRNRFLVVDIETDDKGIATYQTGLLFDTLHTDLQAARPQNHF